jgi:hypothetical protein
MYNDPLRQNYFLIVICYCTVFDLSYIMYNDPWRWNESNLQIPNHYYIWLWQWLILICVLYIIYLFDILSTILYSDCNMICFYACIYIFWLVLHPMACWPRGSMEFEIKWQVTTKSYYLLLLLLFIVHSINPYPAKGLQM